MHHLQHPDWWGTRQRKPTNRVIVRRYLPCCVNFQCMAAAIARFDASKVEMTPDQHAKRDAQSQQHKPLLIVRVLGIGIAPALSSRRAVSPTRTGCRTSASHFSRRCAAEHFADETKGSLMSGFELARHRLPRTFRVAPMIWQVPSGGKNACIRIAATVDVGTVNGFSSTASNFLIRVRGRRTPREYYRWHEHICQTLDCADSTHTGVPALCWTYDDRPRHSKRGGSFDRGDRSHRGWRFEARRRRGATCRCPIGATRSVSQEGCHTRPS